MSNSQLANDALRETRTKFKHHKSANKLKLRQGEEVNKDRRKDAKQTMKEQRGGLEGAMRSLSPSQLKEVTWREIYEQYAEAAAGNCLEYSAYAWRILIGKKARADVVRLRGGGGDHSFVAVGLSTVTPSIDFRQWEGDVWICDGWANICCHAADYPDRWKEKMRKWSGATEANTGPERYFKHVYIAGGWTLPSYLPWMESVETCEKYVVRMDDLYASLV